MLHVSKGQKRKETKLRIIRACVFLTSIYGWITRKIDEDIMNSFEKTFYGQMKKLGKASNYPLFGSNQIKQERLSILDT